ncbi:G-box-binding factor isoform X2 [Nilaparvata lugens]|uniref:EF-hand calcium-binding protein n=1 Tax=Nilaparvata lugens TaxID=108931 RepID=A0A1C9C4S9_NILLU|nr:G-box-binding factor isoform X2 [Nilaparvata lugens]AOM63273.1 EF-hand calcium-binding protein [Nilaparvata lugens]
MGTIIIPLIVVQLVCYVVGHDRVAPGVPPQHYANQGQYNQHMHQQPGQPPMGQQQQQMHQQPPQQNYQQQQQMPPQQQQQMQQQQMHQPQQMPPQQQQQQQQQHHAHGNVKHEDMLNAANIHQEKDHLKEHLHAQVDTSKMTEQELQFHYFKMHDSDNNNKLDGCELIKSLIHWHEQGHKDPATGQTVQPQEKLFKDEELIQLIDPILSMDDSNSDGYIDYPEFVRAQQKAAKPPPPQQHS